MHDPRLTPARPEVAAKYLEGEVEAALVQRGADGGDRATEDRGREGEGGAGGEHADPGRERASGPDRPLTSPSYRCS